MKEYRIAVVGMGAVGHEMLRILEKSSLPISDVVPMVRRNEGKPIKFRNRDVLLKKVEEGVFKNIDIALFSAGEEASRELAPQAVKDGAVVIDNSNAFRMDPNIPLVIPEVNGGAARMHKGLIANPNCSTIQMLVAIKPIHDLFKIKRIVVSTYQAVSGTGYHAIEELELQAAAHVNGVELPRAVYPHQIAFNLLPHIDSFLENGYTKEEMKMVNETRKILDDPEILVSPTAVRAPVFNCHSESINIETEKPLPALEELRKILRTAPGIEVVDDVKKNIYPMPAFCVGTDKVYIGRIRKDNTVPNGLNIWVVADNLRKGAALNAVQIAELLVANNWVKGE